MLTISEYTEIAYFDSNKTIDESDMGVSSFDFSANILKMEEY